MSTTILKAVIAIASKADTNALARMSYQLAIDTDDVLPHLERVRRSIRSIIGNNECICLIARNETGEPVGMAIGAGTEYSDWQDGYWQLLTDLFVTKAYRGLGIGRQLIRAFELQSRERGRLGVQLMCRHDNDAMGFYDRLNYSTEPYAVRRKKSVP